MSDYLIHYGVKGMKWGVRRYRPSGKGGHARNKQRNAAVSSKSISTAKKRAKYKKMALDAYDVYDPMIWDERMNVSIGKNPKLRKMQLEAEERAGKAGNVDDPSFYKEVVKYENQLREPYRLQRVKKTRKYVDNLLKENISVKDFDRMSGAPSIRALVDDHFPDMTIDEIRVLFPERIEGSVVRDVDGRVVKPKERK